MLVLASTSPRRKQILTEHGISFIVVPPEIDESIIHVDPKNLPALESKLKAYAVKSHYPDDEVLACDTIVLLDGVALGKPIDEEDAIKMLKAESNKKQVVISGYTYIGKGKEITRSVYSEVYFNKLSEEEIIKYVKEKRPLDKAGAYGIQDGYGLIDHIEGSYYNVMGLPIEDILAHTPI